MSDELPPPEPVDVDVSTETEQPAPPKKSRAPAKDWSKIPVPESPFHGDWCPTELGWMREATLLPYHPDEPYERAVQREHMKRAPREFHALKARLEKDLRDRADRAEERELAEKERRAEKKAKEIAGEGLVMKDMGYERVVELGKRLLGDMAKALKEGKS